MSAVTWGARASALPAAAARALASLSEWKNTIKICFRVYSLEEYYET